MANFIILENDRLRPDADARVVKAADYAVLLDPGKVLQAVQRRSASRLKQAEAMYSTEKQRGFQQGLDEARRQMAAQVTETALRCETFCRELEAQAIGLVMDVVKKVLDHMDCRQLAEAQVKKALARFKGCKRVQIKVDPAQAHIVRGGLARIMAACPGVGAIEVKAVEGLPKGTLVLESETGIVEASMPVQLAAIEQAFKNCERSAG
jgi:type III secretion protein L